MWLDRKPPPENDRAHGLVEPWCDWFDDDWNYLGERSARVGPDPVGAVQACGCEVCVNGSRIADVGSESTNDGKTNP